MGRQSKITYYSNLSVKKNAEKNKVSEAAIRDYIKRNAIDRNGERKVKIIEECRAFLKDKPKSTKTDIHKKTGHSLATIRKYWTYISTDTPFTDFGNYKTKNNQESQETILEPKGNGKELMSSAIKDIYKILQEVDRADVKELSDFFNTNAHLPLLCIGNGGAQRHFLSLLYGMNGGVGLPITPYMLPSLSEKAIKGSKAMLLSSGGGNRDILYATEKLLAIHADTPNNVACITRKRESKMMDLFNLSKSKSFLFFEKEKSNNKRRIEEPFISVRGKFYQNALLYRAFSGNTISDKIKVNLDPNHCYSYRLNRIGKHTPSFKQINHVRILYGGYGYPVAADMESFLAETGLLSATLTDYRDYCHGRFIFESNHTQNHKEPRKESDVAVVLLITPREENIANQILSDVIPARTPIIIIRTEHNSALASIDLQIKANVLLCDIGEKHFGINPQSPQNYSNTPKDFPRGKVRFEGDFRRWGTHTIIEPDRTHIESLKAEIDNYLQKEEENSRDLEILPSVIKIDIYKPSPESYDVSKYQSIAFRRNFDTHKGALMPFGNMNQGFPYKIGKHSFHTSESAYICGLFSDNTPEHMAVQEELIKETNGYAAKKEVRHKHQSISRKDWESFNVEWMLYIVWQKVKKNKKFRELLMSIPKGVILIENTSLQKVRKDNDTSGFWGARNQDYQQFCKLVGKYIEEAYFYENKAKQEERELTFTNNFCNYGVYHGHNTMGKILSYIKDCLHDAKEPEIDYELLRSKNIYLMGELMKF